VEYQALDRFSTTLSLATEDFFPAYTRADRGEYSVDFDDLLVPYKKSSRTVNRVV